MPSGPARCFSPLRSPTSIEPVLLCSSPWAAAPSPSPLHGSFGSQMLETPAPWQGYSSAVPPEATPEAPEAVPEAIPCMAAPEVSPEAVPEAEPEDKAKYEAGRSDKCWAAEADGFDDGPLQPHSSSHVGMNALLRKCANAWSPKWVPFALGTPAFASVEVPLPQPPAELRPRRSCEAVASSPVESESELEDPSADTTDGCSHAATAEDVGARQQTSILLDSKEARFMYRAKWQRVRRRVSFAETPESKHITPYAEVYGMHPRLFDFDSLGNKVKPMSSELMSLRFGSRWEWF